MNNLTTMMTAISLAWLLMLMFNNMTEKSLKNKEKNTTFECGFNSITPKKLAFSTNFFLITLMFIIFDVEISFLIPTMLMNKTMKMTTMISTIFLVLLTMILMKEWKQGVLEWNK